MTHKLFVIALALLSLSLNAQEDQGKSGNARINEVDRDIYLYKNRGGNVLIAKGKEHALVVDSQFDDLAKDLIDEVERATKQKVRYLINTHYHGDHTGGNVKLVEEGAIVFAQDNTRTRLIDMMRNAEANKSKVGKEILPVVTFDQSMNFYFKGEKVVVSALSGGHTDGDAVVHFTGSNVIHTGDAFVNGRYPYFDTDGGGSYQGYVEGLGQIIRMIDDNTRIVPGHGDIADKKDVEYLQRLLTTVFKRVRAQYLKEKSLAEIQSMLNITSEFDAKGFGDHFITRERFVEAMYNAVREEYNIEDIEEQRQRFKDAQRRANLLNSQQKEKGKN